MVKAIILTFVYYYLPGYKSGGPVRTIANMVDHLGDDFDFCIVTSDRDSFEKQSYPNIQVNQWNSVGSAQIFYAAPDFMRFQNVVRLLRDTPHDVLYLNSFFNPKFTLLPLLARRLRLVPDRPIVLAPRGEFSEGAVVLRAWKKQPYLMMARLLGLYQDLTWQASSENEATDIRRVFGRGAVDIRVAANLPPVEDQDLTDSVLDKDVDDSPLRVVFLSRVSPMKNLNFALCVLAKVRVPLVFNIYGLVDNEPYWQRCKEQIAALPSHLTVRYHGVIEYQRVAEVLATHDLFFLPTRGENYGHAIREALAAGTPVLISDQTPWLDLDEEGVGWVRSLEKGDAFVEVIERLAAQGRPARRQQRALAHAYAKRVSSNTETIKHNLDLFAGAIKKVGRG